jgi:hypothetical protein
VSKEQWNVLKRVADIVGLDGVEVLESYKNLEQKKDLKTKIQSRIEHSLDLRDLKLNAEGRETKLIAIVDLVFRDQISPRQFKSIKRGF